MININRVDLNLLGVFHAILETSSVTLAAERFGITQPAMSNALARLRKLFADPLFVNGSNGMQATPYALEIAGPIKEALHQFQRVLGHRKSFDPSSSGKAFRFHMTDMGQINFLPPMLERLKNVAPNVIVEAQTLTLEAIRNALEAGRIDFALGHLTKLNGRGIRTQALVHERYDVLMRAGHPAAKEPLTQKAFLRASHVVVTSVGGGHQIVEETLVRKQANIMARVPSVMAIPLILSRTDMVSTIPRQVADEIARTGPFIVAALPIKIPEFEVCAFWHERFDTSSENVWMRNQLIDLFAK
jgi:DNA-binding transcriptional LysR family regulator